MNRQSHSAEPWKQLRLAIAILAVAIFGWGLHYKLTLYTPVTTVQASAPAAKLLSQRERPARDEGSALRSPERPPSLGILLYGVVILLIGLLRFSPLEALGPNQLHFNALFEKIWSIRPPPYSSPLA